MVSAEFEDAASYLSSASSLTNTPNSTKLELYGLFKFLTVSPEPSSSRPGIFDFAGRAKWDAWKSAGQTWRGRELEAEERYKEIAKSLGWDPSARSTNNVPQQKEPTAEELLDQSDDEPSGGGGGLGAGVSTLQREPEVTINENTLHGLALQGDAQKLDRFLKKHPSWNLNELDEYGFTALHLACDRGNIDIVSLLLANGADITVKDEDGLTALDLACETNHESIVHVLKKHAASNP